MMEHLSSMFIDDEMDLREKILFIDKINGDRGFYQNTRDLLMQEESLRTLPDTSMLPNRPPVGAGRRRWWDKIFKPVIYASTGFAAAGALILGLMTTPAPVQCTNRFLIFEPAAHRVDLAGSFTGWQRLPMTPIGDSGYWELRLQVPSGEHRFAYILDGSRQIVDPTLPVREKDDFGGENSILNVGRRL